MSTNAAISLSPSAPGFPRLLGGVWRLTYRRFFTQQQALSSAVVLAATAGLCFTATGEGGSAQYYQWATGFYLGLIVPLLAFILAGGALRDELKSVTADYVFTRPVNRALYTLAKYISYVLCLQALYAVALLFVAAIGLHRGVSDLGATLPTLFLAQALTVCAAAGFGFLLASLTGRFVIVGLIYATVVEEGLGRIPTQLNQLSMLRHVKGLLQSVPHLSSDFLVAPQGPLVTAGILLLFSALTVALSAAVLRLREFSGSAPRES